MVMNVAEIRNCLDFFMFKEWEFAHTKRQISCFGSEYVSKKVLLTRLKSCAKIPSYSEDILH